VLGLMSTVAAMSISAQQSLLVGSRFAVRPEPWIVASLVGLAALLVWIASTANTSHWAASAMFIAGGMSYPLYLIHDEIGPRF
jgi:peptidoglycan/LPS O-acetylase OafA/YrhL